MLLKKFEASTHDIKQKQIHSPLTNNQKQLNKLKWHKILHHKILLSMFYSTGRN